jgi:hypothetical protein
MESNRKQQIEEMEKDLKGASTHGNKSKNGLPKQQPAPEKQAVGAMPEPPQSDSVPPQLLQLQKSDAEMMQQATALELTYIARIFQLRGLARQALTQGRRPKDEELGKLYDLVEREFQRYQDSDPCHLPFFIQPEGGEVDQITIEMIAFDSTLDLADPTNTDPESLLELLFEPAQPPQALPGGRVARLKLTAAA